VGKKVVSSICSTSRRGALRFYVLGARRGMRKGKLDKMARRIGLPPTTTQSTGLLETFLKQSRRRQKGRKKGPPKSPFGLVCHGEKSNDWVGVEANPKKGGGSAHRTGLSRGKKKGRIDLVRDRENLVGREVGWHSEWKGGIGPAIGKKRGSPVRTLESSIAAFPRIETKGRGAERKGKETLTRAYYNVRGEISGTIPKKDSRGELLARRLEGPWRTSHQRLIFGNREKAKRGNRWASGRKI